MKNFIDKKVSHWSIISQIGSRKEGSLEHRLTNKDGKRVELDNVRTGSKKIRKQTYLVDETTTGNRRQSYEINWVF